MSKMLPKNLVHKENHDHENEPVAFERRKSNKGAGNLLNFKGIYADDNDEPKTDKDTGAHFQFFDIY